MWHHQVQLWFQFLLGRFTTFTDSSDYFGLYKTLATISAIHYDASCWFDRAIWIVYRSLPILVNISYFYKAYRLMLFPEDNTSAASVIASVWGFTEGTLRICLIELRYGTLSSIMSFLNERSYRQQNSLVRQQRATLFGENNRIQLILVATMLMEAIWFMTTQLFSRDAFMLQVNGHVVDSIAVQILYGLLSNVWGLIYVLSFAIFYIIMNTLHLEMSILLDGITSVQFTVMRRLKQRMETLAASGHSSTMEQQVFWNILQPELNSHISRHVDLLENLKEFSSIVGPFSFVQYYGTLALIADCGFILSIEGLSANGMIYLLFVTVLVFQSFILCRGIEKLNDLNEAIGQALYSGFDWPDMLQYDQRFRRQYATVRHTLMIVIGRSQKGFQCSYGGLGSISMERFAQLMQKSYSLLTILLQFAK
uniref:Olfactory receptor Or61 n=1 Tax=Anopheles quadriannulatus TaxID=34691 RepID=A0A8F5SKR0_ANOQN|nr:olfactory receptor Or61 [Anopheles quadriannulatus]